MQWSETEVVKALHRARSAAKAARRPVAIVANTGNSLFGRFRGPWRVEPNPTPSDQVLISDVGARLWSQEMCEAWATVVQHAPDAADAFKRVLELCAYRDDGQQRDPHDRAEMLLALGDMMAQRGLNQASEIAAG